MHFTHYHGLDDRQRMLELVWHSPARHAHVVDLPYRLCSWAMDDPSNIGLWVNDDGALLAWAVMQAPFWTIDFGMGVDAPSEALGVILDWVDEKARPLLPSPYGRPSWFVPVLETNTTARQALENAGFVSHKPGEEPWAQVCLALNAGVELPPCTIKRGYQLRPIRGARDVPAYVALHRQVFGTGNMTEPWRLRTLLHPAYRPELDLIIENAEGEFVAFCIGWVAAPNLSTDDGTPAVFGQIEPLGVLEQERRNGLAWSIIAEAIRRMRALGAETIYVHTDNYRDRAFAFYQAVGFQVVERILMYRKDYD